MKQTRQCEVMFAYNPLNSDELKLDVGEIIEIIQEVKFTSNLTLKFLAQMISNPHQTVTVTLPGNKVLHSCLIKILSRQSHGKNV